MFTGAAAAVFLLNLLYRIGVSGAPVGLPLSYGGGPVQITSKTYAIFWDPGKPALNDFPASYDTVIGQYFTDVAADSTGTQNVYSVGTQYFDKNPNGTISDIQTGHKCVRASGTSVVAGSCSGSASRWAFTATAG